MPFIVNPKLSVMTFGYEKCRCEFTMQSVQEITKLSITKVFPLKALCKDSHNVFTRLADPEAHREPVTSRPAYLNVIGRIVKSGGRRTIHLTSTHADADAIRNSLNLIGQFLGWVDSIAEQLKPDGRWTLILTVAFRKLLRLNPRRGPNPTLIPA